MYVAKTKALVMQLHCYPVAYLCLCFAYEPRHEKTNVLVSDQVRHKLGCTATEDDWRLEISD